MLIDISLIDDGTRLRKANDEQVAALVDSIKEVGLLSPITVYERKVIRSGIAVDGYGLISGLHRKVACLELGMDDIPAQIVDLKELERQIAECDENLVGPSLTPSERAMFTRRRKQAYEALHPETRNGGDRRGSDRQVGELKEVERFTANTASKTGQSERAVQRDAERGEKVVPEAMNRIIGTKLDTGAYLDKIKKVPREEQVETVERDMSASPVLPTDQDRKAAQRQRFFDLWDNLDEDVRQSIRDFLLTH